MAKANLKVQGKTPAGTLAVVESDQPKEQGLSEGALAHSLPSSSFFTDPIVGFISGPGGCPTAIRRSQLGRTGAISKELREDGDHYGSESNRI